MNSPVDNGLLDFRRWETKIIDERGAEGRFPCGASCESGGADKSYSMKNRRHVAFRNTYSMSDYSFAGNVAVTTLQEWQQNQAPRSVS